MIISRNPQRIFDPTLRVIGYARLIEDLQWLIRIPERLAMASSSVNRSTLLTQQAKQSIYGIYKAQGNSAMLTRIFKRGHSQAVRIPKDLNFDADVQEVEIERKNDALIIRPRHRRSLAGLMDRFAAFPADFMAEGREFNPERERGTP